VADKQRAQKRGLQPSKGESDRMDRPVLGSGGTPSPEPMATGFAEPIETAAEASAPKVRAKSPAPQETGAGRKP
jgi:hypothetical protein